MKSALLTAIALTLAASLQAHENGLAHSHGETSLPSVAALGLLVAAAAATATLAIRRSRQKARLKTRR